MLRYYFKSSKQLVMKIIQNIFILVAIFTLPTIGFSQKKVTQDTIIVEGVCGMCKTRIEEAAFGKGVKFAEWTKETGQLTLVYRSDKTSLDSIESRIVEAGHSTENKAAEKEDYTSLPECCRYEHQHKH